MQVHPIGVNGFERQAAAAGTLFDLGVGHVIVHDADNLDPAPPRRRWRCQGTRIGPRSAPTRHSEERLHARGKPTGSRPATPLLLIQHQPGQYPTPARTPLGPPSS
jgi:hypothetical protein